MSSAAGPSITTSGLVLDFDAANIRSYGYPNVEVLVVAGGGGGGGRHAGGGGGGGVLYNSMFAVTVGAAITVTVGASGTAAPYGGIGGNGGNSTFSTLTAIGGGGGGGYSNGGATVIGATGGSGGGAAAAVGLPGGTGTPGAGTSGQGFAGGASGSSWAGGGGGGAGSAGGTGGGANGGNGGNGLAYSISGNLTYYGGGGGGCGDYNIDLNGGAGGLGGGGRGTGAYNPIQGVAGTANTGGGGGGSRDQAGTTGGSGVVIIRYPGLQKATGGTITIVNGFTIHTFTANGTFTPGTNWADVSGNSIVGTLNNSPVYSSANGGSLVFNGSNTWIESPTSTLFDTQSLTMESWCKPATLVQDGFLFEKGQVNTQYSNFFASSAPGQFVFRTIGLSNQDIIINPSTYMTANAWHHIICTYGAGIKTIYVNGVQVSQVTGITGTIPTGQTNQYIGKYGNAGNNYMFNGSIAVSKVYTRALSAAEVKQNFNATRSRYGL